MKTHCSNRNGAVLIVVLVCLGFAATVMVGALRSSLQQRRQIRNERDVIQTDWLLDAGVRLAVQKLKTDVDYPGQELVFKQGLRSEQVGSVKIKVSRGQAATDYRLVQVLAKLERPENSFGITRSHSFNLPLNESPN